MTKHIGIVACSAEGAALCYRTICLEGARDNRDMHPEVTMHTFPFGLYTEKSQQWDDWRGVGELMLGSAHKLASAGAEFLICPDNTIHQALEWVLETSPLPWLHIAEEVGKEAARVGRKRLGILGTKFLMASSVYQSKMEPLGIESVIPNETEREQINRIIFEELIKGVFSSESRKCFSNMIATLKMQGCDGVVLGCTEIPLLVSQEDSSLPVFDSTRILARAALKEAVR